MPDGEKVALITGAGRGLGLLDAGDGTLLWAVHWALLGRGL